MLLLAGDLDPSDQSPIRRSRHLEPHLGSTPPGLAREEQLDVEPSAREIIRERGSEPDILDVLPVASVEIAVAPHAAQPPEVLILEIASVAPAEDLKGYQITAGLHVARDVELGLEFAVLAVTDERTVDPQREVRRHRTEVGR